MRPPACLYALSAVLPAAAGAQLTISVPALPAATPAGAVVHVAGTFNGWDPAAPGWTLARQPDGSYALTLPDSVRGPVAFKLALGAWAQVETAADGADVPNRVVTVPATGALTYTATVGGWRAGGPAPARPHTASPGVRVLSDSFAMPELGGRTRRVWVYLPPGYARSRRRYPVLYLHDGQNVFDAATSFAGEWGVDEALDSLAGRGAPAAIVVAVDNGGAHRMDEYDPWRAAEARLGGGEGDAYVRWLARTLKPYVDAHYRTRPDARHTAVAGSSMGGLVSLYAGLRYPAVFGRAGVFSCACWVARDSVLALARRARAGRWPARFYFVAAAREGDADPGAAARDQAAVVDALRASGWVPGRTVAARVASDGAHAEWFWRREFPAAYAWLARGWGADTGSRGPAARP